MITMLTNRMAGARQCLAPTNHAAGWRVLRMALAIVVLTTACAATPTPQPTNTPAPTTAPIPSAQPTVTQAPKAVPIASTRPTAAPTKVASKASPTAPAAPTATAPTTKASKIKVIATFSVLGDFVRNVAGDVVELTVLVGPDGDVHEFEPAPSDSVRLAEAAVIVENGLGLEGWLENLYIASGSKAVRVVAGNGITPREIQDKGKPETDPHIWQNPQNAIQMVKNIEAGLTKADATHADVYKKNAAIYIKKLQSLDTELAAAIDTLGRDQRKLVTSHDALGYFADHYGFEIVGSVIQSLSTEAGEPSAKDMANLVSGIQSTGARAIFLESMTNPALVERIATEAGVKIGPQLYTDALGAPGSEGATYLEAMRHNARAIVETLR